VKVLFLTTSFPRSDRDYSGVFVFHLARHLGRAGLDIDVVTPNDGSAKDEETRDGIRVHRFHFFLDKKQTFVSAGGGIPGRLKKSWLPILILPFFFWSFLIRALREAKHNDLLHCQWLPLGILGMIVQAARKKPFVVNVRGSDKLFFRRGFRPLTDLIIRRSRAVIFVSRELTAKLPPNKKFIVIPNGVDVGSKRPFALDASRKIILFVGNLSSNKSVETLLQAIALHNNRRDFCAVIVGDGPERRNLISFARDNGLDGDVVFLPALPQAQIFYLMDKSFLFVMPSLSEGRSNVLVEALASGLPVVASKIPENMEIIIEGKTGLLFESRNARDLANKIMFLLNDPALRNTLSEGGKRFIQENGLTWERSARTYIGVYQKALAKEES